VVATLDSRRWMTPIGVAALAVAFGLLAGNSPMLAIAAALGLAFTLLVLANLTAGVVAFTAITFLELLPGLGGSAVTLSKLTGGLLALSWLATISINRRQQVDFFTDHGSLAALGVAFLALVALSTLWAEAHQPPITTAFRYALNLALLPIVYTGLRRREHAVWMAAAFVTASAAAAAYGLVSHPDVSSAGSEQLDRVIGTIGDPNELAAVLVAGLMLGAALARLARSPALKILAATASVLCLATVFLTLSRGGMIALAAALTAGVLFGGRARPTFVVVAALIAFSTVAYFTAVATPAARDRITHSDGGTGRTDLWTVGWRVFKANPVVGVGGGNFQVSSLHYVLEPGTLKRADLVVERHEVTHNMYLQTLAELGIVGLALFLSIIGACLACALRAARTFRARGDPGMELLSRALIMALVGVLAADFFLSSQFSKQLWLLLAMGPALQGLSLRPEGALGPPVEEDAAS
jgi:O-antigen ligase